MDTMRILILIIGWVTIELVTGRIVSEIGDTDISIDLDKLINDLNTTCTTQVSEEAWKELLPFLQGVVRIEDVCLVASAEGNYTGELKKGVRHGWGEMSWANGTLYGPGLVFYYSVGDRYLGEWVEGQQDGIGTFFSRTGVYVGEWRQGLQTGNGTAIYNNGNKYTGQFVNGFKEGYGKFSVSNGDVYTGYFVQGQRNGQGIEIFYTGERYVGQYEGDLQNGIGTAYYSIGAVKYVGEWLGGSPHGNGTYVALNGDRYEGSFRKGVITGPGTIYETNGNIRFLQDNESIEFRNASNKYMDLIYTIIEFFGFDKFLEKYRTFYSDVILPNIPG